jgi:hypothetical protein
MGRALPIDILKAGGVSQLLESSLERGGRRVADPHTRVACAPQNMSVRANLSRFASRFDPAPYAARALRISTGSLAEAGILIPRPKMATAPASRMTTSYGTQTTNPVTNK